MSATFCGWSTKVTSHEGKGIPATPHANCNKGEWVNSNSLAAFLMGVGLRIDGDTQGERFNNLFIDWSVIWKGEFSNNSKLAITLRASEVPHFKTEIAIGDWFVGEESTVHTNHVFPFVVSLSASLQANTKRTQPAKRTLQESKFEEEEKIERLEALVEDAKSKMWSITQERDHAKHQCMQIEALNADATQEIKIERERNQLKDLEIARLKQQLQQDAKTFTGGMSKVEAFTKTMADIANKAMANGAVVENELNSGVADLTVAIVALKANNMEEAGEAAEAAQEHLNKAQEFTQNITILQNPSESYQVTLDGTMERAENEDFFMDE